MANPAASAPKRLIGELRSYTSRLEECLEELEPVNQEDLLHWTAILKGVPGTPYERMSPIYIIFISKYMFFLATTSNPLYVV